MLVVEPTVLHSDKGKSNTGSGVEGIALGCEEGIILGASVEQHSPFTLQESEGMSSGSSPVAKQEQHPSQLQEFEPIDTP